jgi:hypothetical protein
MNPDSAAPFQTSKANPKQNKAIHRSNSMKIVTLINKQTSSKKNKVPKNKRRMKEKEALEGGFSSRLKKHKKKSKPTSNCKTT